ncbi:tRNA (adenosine(37)-N6)-threonylcarbamoyltransferase complex dimerization subunit type 1 TsaB [Flavobacterium sp. H122]|uniref:tRNA (adenosine(37)-N6)-threonylcarbamoyltransferase complex dimerization subunit type 1 TsaB n=1 Tax=Flavobacterium sp. H122 TaxID=2529860 RepID=UPI0010AA2E9C|nr:tRNA (adenosine(37)-N6)-threonylcarbamoyltransferase complex dimerization subunit type 1 TsaB [Flavobacterium sp. H122]
MAYILHIETATKNCSVALAKEGQLIAVKEIAETGYTHAEKLHVFIEEVLQEAKITFKDLNAVAVSQGPGSYTGLRIGVSAAKGLCYALSVPLIAIDTLEALARKISVSEGIIIPMIDARRMECYTAVFDSQYNKFKPVEAQVIDGNSFADFNQTIHFAGDGAEKCKAVLNSAQFIYHDDVVYPSASEMCSVAYDKYKKSDTVDVAYFEPFYLKEFMLNTK